MKRERMYTVICPFGGGGGGGKGFGDSRQCARGVMLEAAALQ